MNSLYNKIYEAINNGITKALIIDDEQSQDVSVNFQHKELSADFIPYEYRTVDMGLPVLWCEYNLDAFPGDKPKNWYGDYYAWGESSPKEKYSKDNYSLFHKYNEDGKVLLEPEDDVINNVLGPQYRIPTVDEYNELIEKTSHTWVTDYNNIPGLNGELFKSLINSNTLFFPASGYYHDDTLYRDGYSCSVWTANVHISRPGHICYYYFAPIKHNVIPDFCQISPRYVGLAVRGVK